MLLVLVDMERNGIEIDVQELDKLEKTYSDELVNLEKELNIIAWEAMGDTPININSPEQLSILLYSRKVQDKKKWAEIFNIGSEIRNSVRKAKHQTRYSKTKFNQIVKDNTDKVYKTKVETCKTCNGTGKVSRLKKDGTYGVPRFNCTDCKGQGQIFRPTKQYAGFKITPLPTDDATVNGFSTSKGTLRELIKRTNNDEARNFLQRMVRYSAFTSYRETFIGGIRRALRNTSGRSGRIHPQYLQTVTATGRLSSRDPNFHNQPRGTYCPACNGRGCDECIGTGYIFPIRRVVISRYPGGKIGKADYSQLEFRTAAELSRCSVALKSIQDNVDVHSDTARQITKAGQTTNRQEAKTHTFKPLYGGTGGTSAERSYYKWFLEYYSGIKKWQKELENEAVKGNPIIIPSGRSYQFKNVIRYANGNVSFGTQIKNYPVQGFATADIVPVSAIEVHRRFKEARFKSCLINEVHDDIEWDIYPGEEEETCRTVYNVMKNVDKLILDRYGYEMVVPIDVEISTGYNWLEMEEFKIEDK